MFLGDKKDGVVPAIYAAEELIARATRGASQIWGAADDAVLAQGEATQPQQPAQLFPTAPQEAGHRARGKHVCRVRVHHASCVA